MCEEDTDYCPSKEEEDVVFYDGVSFELECEASHSSLVACVAPWHMTRVFVFILCGHSRGVWGRGRAQGVPKSIPASSDLQPAWASSADTRTTNYKPPQTSLGAMSSARSLFVNAWINLSHSSPWGKSD